MNNKLKILSVASKGGHWEQLVLLREIFANYESYMVTTNSVKSQYRINDQILTIPDCNKDQPIQSIWCLICALILVIRIRPQVVVSTGAAPGLFCVAAGRLLGARTLWIDSIANAERLSLSGRLANFLAHQCLTQWPHLARPAGPHFAGAVL